MPAHRSSGKTGLVIHRGAGIVGPWPKSCGVAVETSPDAHAAVRRIANGIASWVNQLGSVWVEAS
jgi:hypothetical protein